MIHNPKYISFQGQIYITYTGSIENIEVNTIYSVVDSTFSIIILVVGICFALLGLMFAGVGSVIVKDLPHKPNTDDTTK